MPLLFAALAVGALVAAQWLTRTQVRRSWRLVKLQWPKTRFRDSVARARKLAREWGPDDSEAQEAMREALRAYAQWRPERTGRRLEAPLDHFERDANETMERLQYVNATERRGARG